jgi:curved DNA-binding protein CbpA
MHALDEQNFFEILGLDMDANEKAVQAAYFKLAKKWHPDRLPGDMVDVRGKVAKIFARMNEAYQALNDAKKRKEYVELVKSGGGTAKDREMVERVIDSALVFQKGEVFFRKGNLPQAEHLVQQAVDADPEQPEYVALLAWIQAQRKGTPKPAEKKKFLKDQIAMLDAVIKQEPEYERALYYRAELLKRSGNNEAAIKDFKKVARLNPRNIDAVREVRLYDMRHGKKSTPGGKASGLFGRFFGKDDD